MIKVPNFPTFEEWRAHNCKFSAKVGDYYWVIEPFSWSCDGGPTTYAAAIATNEVPLNVYVSKAVAMSERIIPRDTEALRAWYEKTIIDLTREWKEYLFKNYFEEEDSN